MPRGFGGRGFWGGWYGAGEDSGEAILILSAGSSPGFPGGGGQVPIFPNMPLL